jgi:hypothetical protein
VIVANESHQGAIHMQIASIGVDIAKNVFQVNFFGGGNIDASPDLLLNCVPTPCGATLNGNARRARTFSVLLLPNLLPNAVGREGKETDRERSHAQDGPTIRALLGYTGTD